MDNLKILEDIQTSITPITEVKISEIIKVNPNRQKRKPQGNINTSNNKNVHTGKFSIADLIKNKKIIFEPLSYLRGRTINNRIIILDEAQNTTPHEIKSAITRVGKGSRIFINGDMSQTDLSLNKYSDGLSYVLLKLINVDIIGISNLRESVRSELGQKAGRLL
jgi:predicted ribonuclease YlaK